MRGIMTVYMLRDEFRSYHLEDIIPYFGLVRFVYLFFRVVFFFGTARARVIAHWERGGCDVAHCAGDRSRRQFQVHRAQSVV